MGAAYEVVADNAVVIHLRETIYDFGRGIIDASDGAVRVRWVVFKDMFGKLVEEKLWYKGLSPLVYDGDDHSVFREECEG